MNIDQFVERVEMDAREQGDHDSAWTEVQTSELVPVAAGIEKLKETNANLLALASDMFSRFSGPVSGIARPYAAAVTGAEFAAWCRALTAAQAPTAPQTKPPG
jgi:hypothetical protein